VSDHVIDELASLVAGDLSRAETEAVVGHLRGCDECRRELVANVAAAAALRSAMRNAPELFSLPDASPAPAPARPSEAPPAAAVARSRPRHAWRWATGAAVAAVVIVAAFFAGSQLTQPHTTEAQATLHVVGAHAGSGGQVVMRTRDGKTNMLVTAKGLQAPSADRYYEVWLFDPQTQKMLPVGVLGPGGQSSYSLPQSLISQYQIVDISLQQDNGNPAHSNDSVLRARYAA
jgi:anti-sigma-K factor RskA